MLFLVLVLYVGGPEVWKFRLIMQLITSTMTEYRLYFSMMGKKEKLHERSHTSTGRINWILVSHDPDISPDFDLKLNPTALTASPHQIHPVYLALIMSISNLDIVSSMVLSILGITLVLIEIISRKISEERDSRQQQQTEVHVDTEVDTAVGSDNDSTSNL